MKYVYRKGDTIFMKALVGASHIPLAKGETKKILTALQKGEEGLMVLQFGVVRLDKLNGIAPDLDRMEQYNADGIDVLDLPDLIKELTQSKETPQELDMPRTGQMKPLKEIIDHPYGN